MKIREACRRSGGWCKSEILAISKKLDADFEVQKTLNRESTNIELQGLQEEIAAAREEIRINDGYRGA